MPKALIFWQSGKIWPNLVTLWPAAFKATGLHQFLHLTHIKRWISYSIVASKTTKILLDKTGQSNAKKLSILLANFICLSFCYFIFVFSKKLKWMVTGFKLWISGSRSYQWRHDHFPQLAQFVKVQVGLEWDKLLS